MHDFLLLTKALSDGTRLRMMKLLERHELCVCQLMSIMELGQSTASKHLGILKNAGLVEGRKTGTWTFYRLSRRQSNRYSADFLELMSGSLNDDAAILSDAIKLEEIVKEDINTICRPPKEVHRG